MAKATVLMSTYNGEEYLSEQINSIIDQSFDGEITLLIRDDGSGDGTCAIIEAYPQTPSRKIELVRGDNAGPQRSFLELIRIAGESDYYFFADQDDIWYPDKLAVAVSAMEREKGQPVCWCSNYDLFNTDTGEKVKNRIKSDPPFLPLKIIFYNQIPGCTMGFNRELMCLLKQLKLENVMMHDSMALSLCAAAGKVVYDGEARIGHRIHGKNVVGSGHKKIVPHKWIVEKLRLLVKKDDYDVSEMADRFIETGQVKPEYLSDLVLLRDFKKSFRNTVRLLNHPDSHDEFMDRTTLSIRCKILFHIF